MTNKLLLALGLAALCGGSTACVQSKKTQKNAAATVAPKPLFRDPIYDGAADPEIVWNKKEKKWFMFYTNRRASLPDSGGVKWVHGTRIGIAESSDGARWTYRDTADIDYRPVSDYTHWAPGMIEHEGTYHMYLTYVPGVFNDWNHPRTIIHLTSTDLFHWKYQSTVPLANDKVIDASVYRLPDGTWRMWYNNERDRKSIYYADSKDLYQWENKGKATGDRGGEGPKVFRWKDKYWMVVDNWAGMSIYHSDDLLQWTRQPNRILEEPGTGAEDAAIGGHADVVVNDGRAFIYYFTHPGRSKANPAPPQSVDARRSLIQVAELEYKDGVITCDRNKEVKIRLKAPK
ncbi:family 43 glycosylhydrolase [Paraflavisolibacter sp. H34]|uniref:family 43 glycosylhydrolase n=1 Tax=Huijunlia imazamoxiresistens TaxID=3127457 RepID=UPI00301907F7